MPTVKTTPPPESSPIVWLATLSREAEDRAAAIAPLTGAVRKRQRPWSHLIDVLEAERQQELEPLRCAA
jgi:hypothetical protein